MAAMPTLSAGLDYVDLMFLDRPQIIAAALLHSVEGVAIVDPGPASTLPALVSELERRGMSVADVRTILLTHIHLDHAGATGSLLARNPAIDVYVHERGAPHMVDPSKLLASARRLYGDSMDRLWGEFLAVPADKVRVMKGGERNPPWAASWTSRTRPATRRITSGTSIARAASRSRATPRASGGGRIRM